jgi:uncharacterized protein YndB with AHSA1/START domain
MLRIEATARSRAGADAVYELLTAGATWPSWSGHDSFELEREGDEAPEGVGAIRVFRRGRIASRERVVEAVPGRRLSYELLSGMPLRDYRATVDLTPDGDGTLISWRSQFTPKVPGTGRIYRRFLQVFIERAAKGLAARAAASTGAR